MRDDTPYIRRVRTRTRATEDISGQWGEPGSVPAASAATGTSAAPDITVVVIVYNDAARLPTAVRSALDADAARRRGGDRGRPQHGRLVRGGRSGWPPSTPVAYAPTGCPENSGGCGAPRNHGIAQARGGVRHVPRQRRRTGAQCLPEHAGGGRDAPAPTWSPGCASACTWTPAAARRSSGTPGCTPRTRTLESIAELPDLLVFDTLSTNKCYRREFLLEQGPALPRRHPLRGPALLGAGVCGRPPHHPDPEPGLRLERRREGRHEVDQQPARTRSPTSRTGWRSTAGSTNCSPTQGLPELKFHKDVKFLKHDLVLHLRDLPFRDAAYRQEFAALARDYLDSIDRAAFDEVEPIHAICAYLLRGSDWDNLLPAVDTLTNRDKISSPLLERDGRIYWCAEHLRRRLRAAGPGRHRTRLSRQAGREDVPAQCR